MASRERGARLGGMLGGVGFGMSRVWWFSFWERGSVRCWGCRSGAGRGKGGEGRSERFGCGLEAGWKGYLCSFVRAARQAILPAILPAWLNRSAISVLSCWICVYISSSGWFICWGGLVRRSSRMISREPVATRGVPAGLGSGRLCR